MLKLNRLLLSMLLRQEETWKLPNCLSIPRQIWERSTNGMTPLRDGQPVLDIGVVRLLLNSNAKVDPKIKSTSEEFRRYSSMLASGEGRLEVVRVLLSFKADINAQTNTGRTALHCTVGKGRVDVIGLLLSEGANTQLKCNGKTALEYAEQEGKTEIAKLLKDFAASV